MENFTPTDRTTLKRLPKRGIFDRSSVYRILDEGFVCHVGFAIDGRPYVIPTSYCRVKDTLYIHGSAASRMLQTIRQGVDVCITVTLIDGLVLARSAFHHSMNYRSILIFGRADIVEDQQEKMEALHAFTEHVVPGRWRDVRHPTESELKSTLVLSLPLVEVSAKVRSGPPLDDEDDYLLPVWAGEIPLRMVAESPVKDPRSLPGVEAPQYATEYCRPGTASRD